MASYAGVSPSGAFVWSADAAARRRITSLRSKLRCARVGASSARPGRESSAAVDETLDACSAAGVTCRRNPSEKSVLSRAFANRRLGAPDRAGAAARSRYEVRDRSGAAVARARRRRRSRARRRKRSATECAVAGRVDSPAGRHRSRAAVLVARQAAARHAVGVARRLRAGCAESAAVTGDVRPVGDYPDATAVVDVDSIGLVNAVSRLNQGLDVGGQTIGSATRSTSA